MSVAHLDAYRFAAHPAQRLIAAAYLNDVPGVRAELRALKATADLPTPVPLNAFHQVDPLSIALAQGHLGVAAAFHEISPLVPGEASDRLQDVLAIGGVNQADQREWTLTAGQRAGLVWLLDRGADLHAHLPSLVNFGFHPLPVAPEAQGWLIDRAPSSRRPVFADVGVFLSERIERALDLWQDLQAQAGRGLAPAAVAQARQDLHLHFELVGPYAHQRPAVRAHLQGPQARLPDFADWTASDYLTLALDHPATVANLVRLGARPTSATGEQVTRHLARAQAATALEDYGHQVDPVLQSVRHLDTQGFPVPFGEGEFQALLQAHHEKQRELSPPASGLAERMKSWLTPSPSTPGLSRRPGRSP
jgi:hypothetical protein